MDTYERLIELLAALTADGEITEEQAAGVLLTWREIADLDVALPLPTAQGIIEEPEDSAAVFLLLVAILGARAAHTRRTEDILRRLAPRYRRPVIDMIQNHHAAEAARLADDLAAGRLTVSGWQTAARRLNQTTIRAMVELAGGAGGSYAEIVRGVQIEQAAYLQRFAEQIAATRIRMAHPDLFPPGRNLSFEQIAARLAMYSGAGRGLYFGISEAEEGEDAGWIVLYHARDDSGTCSPCSAAAAGSPYLPGNGPMPGDVCLGGGACRCWRELVFDPDAYASLTA